MLLNLPRATWLSWTWVGCANASLSHWCQRRLGDYVIVHVGHALGLLDEAEALASLALFAELAQSELVQLPQPTAEAA